MNNTPNGRKQFDECYALLRQPTDDPVKKAWAFLIVSYLGYRGVYAGSSNYWAGRSPKNVNGDLKKLPQIIKEWEERFLRCDWSAMIGRRWSGMTRPNLFFADLLYPRAIGSQVVSLRYDQ